MMESSVTIIGGGLSGLICAIILNRDGFHVRLVEKKHYPFHRVCGEYISNEVLAFLKSIDIDPKLLGCSSINRLAITSPSGNAMSMDLDLGGFGLSRFLFDNFLYQKALSEGVEVFTGSKANELSFDGNIFSVVLSNGQKVQSRYVVAAYGKRSNLDKTRSFFRKRSPYLGVKYHIKTDFPNNLVRLDNFDGGYSGIVKIERDLYNLCYLTRNHHLQSLGSVEAMENEILFRNPHIKHIFKNSDFIHPRPEVINEISFEKKSLVEDHVFYCGDAAAMISPLCGNGMAMAMHAAKILAESISRSPDRPSAEAAYITSWNRFFNTRLKVGRWAQTLFGNPPVSELAVGALQLFPTVARRIVKLTHGNPF